MIKVSWGRVGASKIVMLEGTPVEKAILEPLFGQEPCICLYSHPSRYVVNFKILLNTALQTIRARSLKVGYTVALLRCIQPKIVVTFIDNSVLFQRTAKHYKSARFLAIQNGGRTLARDHPPSLPTIFHSEFACMGENDVAQHRAHGAEVHCYYPVGSLKDAYYREQVSDTSVKKSYDLCLVSQIKKQHYQHYPKTMQSLELLAFHLRRFCAKHGTSICVAARRHPQRNSKLFEWESDWFHQNLGSCAEIIPNIVEEYTSYQLVDQSQVSLGLNTTLLREGFGRGNRILSCNYTGDARIDFPVPGPWCLSDSSYEAFEEKLLYLLGLSDAEYVDICAGWPRYVIGYDHEKPTHVFLRELIAEAVQAEAGNSEKQLRR